LVNLVNCTVVLLLSAPKKASQSRSFFYFIPFYIFFKTKKGEMWL
jgi:hypothetical protein